MEAGGRKPEERGAWLAVLALCAAPRIAAAAIFWPPADTQYAALARSLAGSHRYALDAGPTARIEPFYPALLAAGQLLGSMLAVQVAAASVAGVFLFALVRRQLGSTRAAWIATLLYAFSPYLVRQSAAFMEVTLAIVLLIVTAWRMQDVRTPMQAIEAGALFAALVLTRFSFLPIALGGALLVWHEYGWARAAAAASVAILCIAPWMAYSRATDGSLLPARIGENLYVSTSEWTRAVVPQTNVDVLVPFVTDSVAGETDPDGVLIRRALAYAREHPLGALELKLRNLLYALQPRLLPFAERAGSASIVDGRLVVPPQRPRPMAYELVAGAFQTLLLLGGAAGFWRRRSRWRADAFLLVVPGSVLGVSVAFFPTSRLLAPATFVLMFYTAVAWPERRRGPFGI